MNCLIYIVKIVTVISYLVPSVYLFYFKAFIQNKKSIALFLFQGSLFVITDLVLTFIHKDEYSMFVFYFADIIRFFSIIYFYQRTIYKSKINFYMMFLGICIFLFENFNQFALHGNDEVFTVFSNISIAGASIYYFYKLNAQKKSEVLSSLYILGFFFFVSSSSLLISVYESEIRTTPSYLALFIIIFYNLMELIQNSGITLLLWRLKRS